MAAPRGMVDCGAEKLTRSFDFDRTGELGFQCRFQFLQDNQTHTCGRMAWKSKRSSQVTSPSSSTFMLNFQRTRWVHKSWDISTSLVVRQDLGHPLAASILNSTRVFHTGFAEVMRPSHSNVWATLDLRFPWHTRQQLIRRIEQTNTEYYILVQYPLCTLPLMLTDTNTPDE